MACIMPPAQQTASCGSSCINHFITHKKQQTLVTLLNHNVYCRAFILVLMPLLVNLQALKMTGSTLGKSSLRVLPSKTAIVPVNKELMPRSEEELERCSRTVYVANIDKKVDREEVRLFFEKLCGESCH